MGKGRFLNQKLAKRMSRKLELVKARLAGQDRGKSRNATNPRLPKKGPSRKRKP